jgi:hypothetical protein
MMVTALALLLSSGAAYAETSAKPKDSKCGYQFEFKGKCYDSLGDIPTPTSVQQSHTGRVK